MSRSSILLDVATGSLDPLLLDFVEWVAREPRGYAEVLDAWKTSCPRLTVWEDAAERSFVTRTHLPGRGVFIAATTTGLAFLAKHGRARSTLARP